MKTWKTSPIVSVVIVVLFFVGVYFLVKYTSKLPQVVEENVPIEAENETPKLVDRSLVSEKSYKTPDQYATFDVVYPQFKQTSAEFNQKIENLAMDAIEGHKIDSKENWSARFETQGEEENISEFPAADEKYSLSVDWSATQINTNFVSTILVFSGYTGGAHGYEVIIPFNYDVVNKKEVTLADLFPNDSDYLKTISEFSRKDLKAQFKDMAALDMLEAGTTPEEMNFSTFTFTPTAITFYFQQYQVAPYAMGISKVTMPRE